MSSKRDYYEILGVSKNASKDDIKKAYRQMAIKYHPDKNPGDKVSEEKFKEAAEAYDILSNDDKRRKYDQFGHAGVGGASSGGFGGPGMSMDDIFSSFGDIFGGHFGFGGFGGRRGGQRVNKGSNLRVNIKVSLEDVINGVEKKINVKKQVVCKSCDGTGAADGNSVSTCSTCRGTGQVTRIANTILGQMQTTSTCPSCNGDGKMITKKCSACGGEGTVEGQELVTFNIPPGVQDGMQLSVSGKGNAAKRGGINGDLIVVISEEQHSEIVREESDLLYNLNVSIPDAILGTQVEIPTVEGRVKIKIEPGVQSGKVLRLRGKGVPSINGYGRGDFLVVVNVWIPKDINKDERKVLEKLNESPSFKPRKTEGPSFFERMRNMFE